MKNNNNRKDWETITFQKEQINRKAGEIQIKSAVYMCQFGFDISTMKCSLRILINYKGENNYSGEIWKIPLKQMNQVNINSNKTYQHHVSYPWHNVLRRGPYHSSVFLTNTYPQTNHEKTLNLPKLRDILKITNQYSSSVNI